LASPVAPSVTQDAGVLPDSPSSGVRSSPLLEVRGLEVHFAIEDVVVRAVSGVTYTIKAEKTLGVVGESGCGKSVTALAIMRLVQTPPGRIAGGEILFHRDGKVTDLCKLPAKGREMRAIRGNEIAMIFQEPMTSLTPVYTIGFQIMEAVSLHQHLRKREAREKAIAMLRAVGIPGPEQRVDEYPHQLSGGMRQRAMIAMALSCNPSLLIADEPTTALDVTIQAQVLDLMNALRQQFHAAIQFITHDLGVIAGMADDIAVMYLGRIVEAGTVSDIFHLPSHPYTQGLMKSIPSLTRSKDRLVPIEGTVPDPSDAPPGCGFEPRCPQKMAICATCAPPVLDVAEGHTVACWLYGSGGVTVRRKIRGWE
jgi:oligopeptide/dipeptide ABC transporter ATP-binding protein